MLCRAARAIMEAGTVHRRRVLRLVQWSAFSTSERSTVTVTTSVDQLQTSRSSRFVATSFSRLSWFTLYYTWRMYSCIRCDLERLL